MRKSSLQSSRVALTVLVVFLLAIFTWWSKDTNKAELKDLTATVGKLDHERVQTEVPRSTPVVSHLKPAEVLQANLPTGKSQDELKFVEGSQNESAVQKDTIVESKRRFELLLQQVKTVIPTQTALRRLSNEQVHHTPVVLQKAAILIGDVAQAIAENKLLTHEGLRFYRTCAENGLYPNSIRATCYFNYEALSKQGSGSEMSLEFDSNIEEHVKKLAKKI